MNPLVLFLALMIDRLIGDPDWLWKRARHPVVLFGALVSLADRELNKDTDSRERTRRKGWTAIVLLVFCAAVTGELFALAAGLAGPAGWLIEAVIVSMLLAQKSLADHVRAVASGLRTGGLEGGRRAVSMIVGRDPEKLDRAGVSRAAIESLAENASDGVVAPALFYLVFGLPGIFAYKMINTADSMIGNRSARHVDFGRGSALTDDWANWIPARLTGLLTSVATLLLYGRKAGMRSFAVMARDARLHRSPNSGWPESAFAGALDIALAGPRIYGSETVNEPMQNAAGRRDLDVADIDEAIRLFWMLCSVFSGFVLLIAIWC